MPAGGRAAVSTCRLSACPQPQSLCLSSALCVSLCLPASLPSPFLPPLPAVCWSRPRCLSLSSASGPWALASFLIEFGSPFPPF